jgi:hypothetical protein
LIDTAGNIARDDTRTFPQGFVDRYATGIRRSAD